jgi:hypothetical protein
MSEVADEIPAVRTDRAFAPPREEAVRKLLGPYGSWPYSDRRHGTDRRLRATPLVSRFSLLRGSRTGGRRRTERNNIYVDRYDPRDLRGVVAILILNLLDAWLTLVYLGYGGTEANPVAKKLLDYGIDWFVGAKSLLVTACLLFLAVHKTFACVRPAMRILMWFYGALLVYHLYLQSSFILQNVT